MPLRPRPGLREATARRRTRWVGAAARSGVAGGARRWGSGVLAVLHLQEDQEHDDGADDRAHPAGRLDQAVTVAEQQASEEAADERADDAEYERLHDGHV